MCGTRGGFTNDAPSSSFSSNSPCDCEPVADFTVTPGPDGLTVHFDASSSSGTEPLTYTWTYGNGGTGSGLMPTYIYSEAGTYLVTLTIEDQCGNISTAEQSVTIQEGSPSSMWLTLSGPTLAAECQVVAFNANVVGGVPPYRYEWDMGEDYYCSKDGTGCSINCNGDATYFGNANETATFTSTGLLTNKVCVKVWDATDAVVEQCLQIKVKPGIQPLEIIVNGTPEPACNGAYATNSQIIFIPDVDPLSAFEYPTDYRWDFDDGTSYVDNFDGGGIAIHEYVDPGDYNVTLTVSDPYGSMQAIKAISICGPGNPGNEWVLSNGTSDETLVMYYPGEGNPIYANISLENNTGQSCAGQNVRWKWQFVDEASSPNIVLNTMPLLLPANVKLFKDCNDPNLYVPQHEYGSVITLDLQDNSCNLMATYNNEKHWGCLSVKANAYQTNPNVLPPDNTTDLCSSMSTKSNPCLIYIHPSELEISNIHVTENCPTYTLSATVEGGGWHKENGNYVYKEYLWTAYDIDNPDEEIDILTGATTPTPGINASHPYFDKFPAGQTPQFVLKLRVTDFANQVKEVGDIVSFNPFRLTVKSEYKRCPEVWSYFENNLLATGGTGTYRFTWTTANGPLEFESGDLHDQNPYFKAPASGARQYTLTVEMLDGNGAVLCQLTKQITVTATPLTFDWTYNPWSICGMSGREIGLSEYYLETYPLGGSGSYAFEWTTANPSDLAYLSDVFSAHPYASGIPVGQQITYTLTATDLFGGCSHSDDFIIQSIANDHTAAFNPATINICYGNEATLTPTVSPINNTPPFGDIFHFYKWSTTNPNHDLSGLSNYVYSLPIDEIVASHPSPAGAPYVYTLRYEHLITGCFAEASVNVTIGAPWSHTGYVPSVRTAIKGTSVPVWQPFSVNEITSGIDVWGLDCNAGASWAPIVPTDIINNSGSIQCLVPRNGKFVPTVAQPFTVLTVTNKATGCSNDYKSIRYILTDEKPELWVSGANPVVCQGGSMCFDIVFDAKVASYETSLLPSKIKASATVSAPTAPWGNGQTKTYFLDLVLDNNLGVYTGQVCVNDFFTTTTLINNPNAGGHYHFGAAIIAPDLSIFNMNGCDCSTDPYTIDVQAQQSFGAYTNCLPLTSQANTMDLGVLPCNAGTTMAWSAEINAGEYIEVHPEGNITFDVEATTNRGAHLFINPCINPQAVDPAPEDITPPPAIAADHALGDSAQTASQAPMLDVFPNPFTDEVTVQYFIPEDCAGEVDINLLDMTGRAIQQVQHIDNCPSGDHQFKFDTKGLSPGVYFYELRSCKHRRAIKKSVKISNN